MARRKVDIADLEARLGHAFRSREHLERALTHISALHGTPSDGPHYQRLEFLGDRVLGLMIAEALMEAFPEATEGDLSRRFHSLVSREACAAIATHLDLGSAIRLAAGETKSGGRSNPTILGDAMEALMAAVYVEGGYEAVKACFKPLWHKALNASGNVSQSNPKSFLQEWAVAHGKTPPVYNLIERHGPDHAPIFTMEVVVGDLISPSAKGKSRQEAEKAAALGLIAREGLS
jgi:ribonuclease III